MFQKRLFAQQLHIQKMVGLLLVLAGLSFGPVSYAQSYHYFENKIDFPGGPVTYYTFLTVGADGTGTARIRYIDPVTSDKRLLELKLVDSILTDPADSGINKYLVMSQEPLLIVGTDDSGFVVPSFVFHREAGGNDFYYSPVAVQYKTADTVWRTAPMLVQQQKSYTDLLSQQDFVSIFFNESDEFFRYLYFSQSRGPIPVSSERFFLVVVANTTDPKIGVTTKKDLDNITGIFTRLTTDLGIPLIKTVIEGNGFDKKSVQLAIAKLKPAPVDIVVFYYSGHGFRFTTDTSKYPRISLRRNTNQLLEQNNLGIEDIYKQLVKKGAKVTIVLSDCCNEDIGSPVPVGKTMLKTRRGPGAEMPVLNTGNCMALFFPKNRVSILTSSAEVNELASGNPLMGGFFTSFFKVGLEESLYGFKEGNSWLRLLLDAKEKARWRALSAICGTGRCVQRAAISVVPPQ